MSRQTSISIESYFRTISKKVHLENIQLPNIASNIYLNKNIYILKSWNLLIHRHAPRTTSSFSPGVLAPPEDVLLQDGGRVAPDVHLRHLHRHRLSRHNRQGVREGRESPSCDSCCAFALPCSASRESASLRRTSRESASLRRNRCHSPLQRPERRLGVLVRRQEIKSSPSSACPLSSLSEPNPGSSRGRVRGAPHVQHCLLEHCISTLIILTVIYECPVTAPVLFMSLLSNLHLFLRCCC